jgi:hypothetical protein
MKRSTSDSDPVPTTTIFLKIELKGENKTVELSVNAKREARLKHQNDILLLKYYIQLFRTYNPDYRSRAQSRPITNDSIAVKATTPLDSMTSYELEQNFYISEFNTYGRKKPPHKHFKNSSDNPQEFYSYDLSQNLTHYHSNMHLRPLDHNTTEFINPTPMTTERGSWGYLVLPGPHPIRLEIELSGIEASLKRLEDYDVLYDYVKNWERNNQDYISDFSSRSDCSGGSRAIASDNSGVKSRDKVGGFCPTPRSEYGGMRRGRVDTQEYFEQREMGSESVGSEGFEEERDSGGGDQELDLEVSYEGEKIGGDVGIDFQDFQIAKTIESLQKIAGMNEKNITETSAMHNSQNDHFEDPLNVDRELVFEDGPKGMDVSYDMLEQCRKVIEMNQEKTENTPGPKGTGIGISKNGKLFHFSKKYSVEE